MRLLVITTIGLFPRDDNPVAGIPFANLLCRLRPHVERIVLVTPPPYVPAVFSLMPFLPQPRALKPHERRMGMEVYRPPYFSIRSARRLGIQSRSFCQAALPMCRSLHNRYRFDLVIAYGLGPPAHTAQCVARTLGLRSVSWAIGSDVHTQPFFSEENMRLLKHTVRHNDVILTESEALRRMLVDFCPGAGNVHTFYKGIDLAGLREPTDRPAARVRLGMAPDRTYMIGMGTTAVTKGVYEFYESLKRLADRRPHLSAIWIGDGPEDAPLRALAARDGLAHRFSITGVLPREAALQYVRAADLLVFPTYAEGLSNTVMEALAGGLPTVTTDVGGDREVLVDEVTGLLVPPKNVDALVAGIDRLLENPTEARRMAQRGRQLILNHFDVAANAAVALEILRHVASGGDPTAPVRACAGVEPGRLPMDTVRESAAAPGR